jgi:hypothetical protein
MQKIGARFFIVIIVFGIAFNIHQQVKLRHDLSITIVEQLTGENATGLAYLSPDSNVIYLDTANINTVGMQTVSFEFFKKILCFFTISPFNINGTFTFHSNKYMMLRSINSNNSAVEIKLNDDGRVVQLKNVRLFFDKMNCLEN